MHQQGRFLALFLGILWGVLGSAPLLLAQRRQAENAIFATSNPYRIEWNGKQGLFLRRAFALEKEKKQPLTFLHTDAGPKGSSKYLAWFLARDKGEFAILWCYLNDSGQEFWCWLYRYPSNELTTVRFQGEYRFTPPAEPLTTTTDFPLELGVIPTYKGPDFGYKQWTRRAGMLEDLKIFPAKNDFTKPEGAAQVEATTLAKLNVVPLHDVRVEEANGWRDKGWGELHTLAFGAGGEPYYLILYDNSVKGFVLNLQKARLYTADFGEKVSFEHYKRVFGQDGPTTLQPNQVTPPKTNEIRAFDIYEVALVSQETYSAPYREVLAEADVTAPDGTKRVVPLFWEGAGSWRLRFSPTRAGTWTYRIRSNDKELHNRLGTLECEGAGGDTKGFLRPSKRGQRGRFFEWADGTAMLSSPVSASVATFIPQEPAKKEEGSTLPASFRAFQAFVDRAAEAGVNRFTDFWLLEGEGLANEGGSLWKERANGEINPQFFAWLDRRIAYCNYRGIVPDIGLTEQGETTLAKHEEGRVRWLWRYVVSRYAGYNVCWVLSGSAVGSKAQEQIATLARMTRQIDIGGHPLLSALPETASSLSIGEEWLDGILFSGTKPTTLSQNLTLQRPLFLRDTQMELPFRERLWESLFRGGAWQFALPTSERTPLLTPPTQALLSATRFLRRTRFWRLEPHNELLGRAEESDEERRRRRRVETSIDLQQQLPAEVRNLLKREEIKTQASVLASPGKEYLLYLPQGGSANLELLETVGKIVVRWYDIANDKLTEEETQQGGDYRTFTAPSKGQWVVWITRA
jgi:hypothetical protein